MIPIERTTMLIEEALKSYGQGIHHGHSLARHIANVLRENEMVEVPEPEPLTEWSDDLAGTWAEEPHGSLVLLLDGIDDHIDVWDAGHKVANGYRPTDLYPRPDLAPVDLTPRPVEGDA